MNGLHWFVAATVLPCLGGWFGGRWSRRRYCGDPGLRLYLTSLNDKTLADRKDLP